MRLTKAKELLKRDIDDPGSVDIMDLNKAEELGIEALKQFELHRRHKISYFMQLLPGETEE